MDGQVLVLNQNYEPLNITNMRRAVTLLHLGKAEVVESADRRLHSCRLVIDAPSVVRLAYFVRRPYPQLRVSRKGVFARDGHRCQYCGASGEPLTLDHVVPVSRGGKHDWTNLVTSCVTCNNAKGDRTPSEMHWSLRVRPQPPHGTGWMVRGVERAEPEWEEFLAPVAA